MVKLFIDKYKHRYVTYKSKRLRYIVKIRITDKFLYEIYEFLEKANDVKRFVFKQRRTLYDVLHRDKNPVFEKYRKEKGRRQFNKFINYLKKYNYIKSKNLQNNNAIIITKKGIGKALRAKLKLENEKLQKRNDGKWVMITFDIPQTHKKARSLLRSILKGLGYSMFQQSVWISPYDVSEKTERLLQFYSIDNYIKIFLIEELE